MRTPMTAPSEKHPNFQLGSRGRHSVNRLI